MLKTSYKIASKIWKIMDNITNRKSKKISSYASMLKDFFTKPIETINKLYIHFANVWKQTCTKLVKL